MPEITRDLHDDLRTLASQIHGRGGTVRGPEYVGRLRETNPKLADALDANVGSWLHAVADLINVKLDGAQIIEPPPPPPPDPPAEVFQELTMPGANGLVGNGSNAGWTPLPAGTCPQLPSEVGFNLRLVDGDRPSFDPSANERKATQFGNIPPNRDFCWAWAMRVNSIAANVSSSDWGWHTIGPEVHSLSSTGQGPIDFGVNVYSGGYRLDISPTTANTASNHIERPGSSTELPAIGEWEFFRMSFRLGADGFARLYRGEEMVGEYSGPLQNGGYGKVQLYRRAVINGVDDVDYVGMRIYEGGLVPLPAGFGS